MKKSLLFMIATIVSTILFSQSNHTIVIDGTNDFTIANEEIAGTASSKWYVTWDATKIYFGLDATDVSSGSSAKWVQLYFDVDPTTNNGTTLGVTYNTQQPSLPFNADFHFRWKADGTYSNIMTFNGSSWVDAGATFGSGNDCEVFQSGTFIEISIKRSFFSSPSDIKLAGTMIDETGGSEYTFFMMPSNNIEGTDANIDHYQGYLLLEETTPNNATYNDVAIRSFDNDNANNLWASANNWTGNTLPDANTLVIVPNTFTTSLVDDGTGTVDGECYDIVVESGANYTLQTSAGHTIHGSVWVYGTVNVSSSSFFDITGYLWNLASGTLTIDAGGQLTVGGSTYNNGSFTVASSSSATGSFIPTGAYSGTGTFNAERYISQDVWHYISAPVADSRIFNVSGFLDLTGGTNNDQLYYWDESGIDGNYPGVVGIWFDILNGSTYSTNSFNTSQGYAITKKNANKTISFVGAPYTSTKSISVTYTSGSSNPGSNLLGNPFSSTIAVNSGAQVDNNIVDINASILDVSAQAIYLWNESGSDYTIINNSSSATYIDPGQGFMVVAKTGGGSFSFDANIRKHGTATFYKSINSDNVGVEMFVTDSENRSNSTQITFMENMTLGLDPSFDGMKLKGNPSIALYTRLVEDNGIDFAIQALPENEIESISIPVGIDVIEATTITFSITSENMEAYPIYLQDIQENTITNLKEENYSTLVSESGIGRFFLHFRDVSDIRDNQLLEHINIFATNNMVQIRNNKPIDATVNIYNIAGQLITTSQFNNESSASISIDDYKGVVIVSITTSGQTINEKVIIW